MITAERMMKKVTERRRKQGKAARLQAPGPDQKTMGEVW